MSDELRPDIAAARARMTTKLGSGREIKKLVDHLWEGEVVQWLAGGTYGGGQGLVALTDRRLFFLKDGIMSKTAEDFPFSRISSIRWQSGLVFGKIVVFVSGNKAEITQVGKAEGKAIVDAVRGYIAEASARPAAVQQSEPSGDVTEQIRKLAELRDQGILTDEEFSAKKAQLLGL